MIASRAIFLLFIALFCGTAAASPESAFWGWFQQNEVKLLDFEHNRDAVFDQLAVEMHKVHPRLTFEFGPVTGGRREFVISAGGMRAAFPAVENLVAAAPPMKKWTITKFRPRGQPFDISYQGIKVTAASVTVDIVREGAKARLTVLIPGYTKAEHEKYAGIAFILLDHALGEYDVETRVGPIDVAAPAPRFAKAIPLKNLPQVLDALLAGTGAR